MDEIRRDPTEEGDEANKGDKILERIHSAALHVDSVVRIACQLDLPHTGSGRRRHVHVMARGAYLSGQGSTMRQEELGIVNDEENTRHLFPSELEDDEILEAASGCDSSRPWSRVSFLEA